MFGRMQRTRVHPLLRWFMLVTPTGATFEMWDRIKRHHKHNHPIRYFLQQTIPHKFNMIGRRIDDKIEWVRVRTTNRFHVLKIHGLKPGYADTDRQMLYANFSLLIDYVEVGLSYRNYDWHQKNPRIRTKLPKLLRRIYRNRCPEAGLDYLYWQQNDPDILLQSPEQATHAEGVERLYRWWTAERPLRINSYEDIRIWEGIDHKRDGDIITMLANRDPARAKAGEHAHNTGEFYNAQDQAMLERLIKLRVGLWC